MTIFLTSWGRPLYLWACLDALWRLTKTRAHIVLLDNAHPDPQMGKVIVAFERRGLFGEVVRFPTNSFANIRAAYAERLRDAGPYHIFMESDALICRGTRCWLREMEEIAENNPKIGMLGSLIDPVDFVAPEMARATGGEDSDFLAKLGSPERGFLEDRSWEDPGKAFFYTEPPCPVANPPGRLMLLRTDVVRETGLILDGAMAAAFRARGFRPAITARVRHRHLSLLNIFDYPELDEGQRNEFFSG